MGIFKQLYKTFVTDPQKKRELLDWLEKHDTPEYHKNPLPIGFRTNRLWYEEAASVELLETYKNEMENYYNNRHLTKIDLTDKRSFG